MRQFLRFLVSRLSPNSYSNFTELFQVRIKSLQEGVGKSAFMIGLTLNDSLADRMYEMILRPVCLFILTMTILMTPLGTLFSGDRASAETFQEALISAYNHPKLQAERARLREIDENYVQAQSAGRLTSSLSGSVGVLSTNARSLNFLTGTELDNKETTVPRNAQIEFIQPLYQGGRVKALKNQAKAGIMAARENLRAIEHSVFQEAAIAYVDVLRDEKLARIRRNNVSVLSRQLGAAQERFDVGEGTLTDIAQAKSRLAGADIGLAQADASLASSRAIYEQIIGHIPVDLQTVPQISIPSTLGQARVLALENNPSLLASQFNEDVADAGLNVANAASRPRLSAVGTLSGAEEPSFGVSRARSASVVAQISVPIFTGGMNRSKKRAASEARNRALFQTRDAKRMINQSVAQIWAQLDAASRTRKASALQVEAAEVAFEGVLLEQDVGTRTTLDVLDAEQELLSAKQALIDAERAYNVATYQLLTVLGAFDAQALQLPVQFYDPDENFDRVRYKGFMGAGQAGLSTRENNKDSFLNKAGSRIIETYDSVIATPLENLED